MLIPELIRVRNVQAIYFAFDLMPSIINAGGLRGYAKGGVVGIPHIPAIRTAVPTSASRQAMTINVNVEGANGDQHVMSLVRQGVSEGIRRNNRTEAPQIAVKAVQQYQERFG